MAAVPQTLSSVLSALAQNFRPQIVATINRRSVLLQTLPIRPGAGKNVAWDAEFDGMLSESFNDGDDALNFGSDAVAPATLSWAMYRANFQVTDLAVAAASSSMSPAGMLDLWGRNMLKASTKLATTLNQAMYNGTTTIVGLDTALQNANTYAGIDRTVGANAGWQANVIDPGSLTTPTLGDIRKDVAVTIYNACGEQPDLAFCSPQIFNKLGGLFDDTRRRNQDISAVTINTARGQVVLDASVGVLQFEGCTFIKDKDATSNRIYYLNSQYVHVEYLPQPIVAPPAEVAIPMNAITDGFGVIPLGLKFKSLAVQGSSRKATAQTFVQLVVEKPNACGVRLNVNPN